LLLCVLLSFMDLLCAPPCIHGSRVLTPAVTPLEETTRNAARSRFLSSFSPYVSCFCFPRPRPLLLFPYAPRREVLFMEVRTLPIWSVDAGSPWRDFSLESSVFSPFSPAAIFFLFARETFCQDSFISAAYLPPPSTVLLSSLLFSLLGKSRPKFP